MFIIWKLLGTVFKPEVKGIVGSMNTITSKMETLGPMTQIEKLSLGILLFTIFLWITTHYTGLNSFSVALIGAALFLIFKIIGWRDAQTNVDWGLIIFFGGALSLGAALLQTGAAEWIINHLIDLLGNDVSTVAIMIVLMIIAVSITQVMSNNCTGSNIGTTNRNLRSTCSNRLFIIIHAPHGRPNSGNGLRNRICEN